MYGYHQEKIAVFHHWDLKGKLFLLSAWEFKQLGSLKENNMDQDIVKNQAPVVRGGQHYKLDKSLPTDNAIIIGFPNTYPLDSELSDAQRYLMFEQLGRA